MECIEKCEFLIFEEKQFYCTLYDRTLKNVEEDETITVKRCRNCIDEEIIGKNTIMETTRKLKLRLGWIMDSFYSFKDDIETEATELYRILKELEEKHESS